MNNFRAVTNTLPKRSDIANWDSKKFIQFFELVNEFTVDGKLTFKTEKLLAIEQKALSGLYPFWQELFHRMNEFSTDPEATPRKFSYKLQAVIRNVGAYIKLNPSVVTEGMRVLIEPNPRLAWMLKHYTTYETKVGATVIVPETRDTTNISQTERALNPKDPNVKMLEATVMLADILHTLVKGITKQDIKNMNARDRIALALKVKSELSNTKSYKPNIGVFNNIVVHKADRESLEKAMLDFGNESNQNES